MTINIIIPLYNKENTIGRAIQSVLHQVYQDFRIIVVDDGSTDRSYHVISQIKDRRIKIIRQSNQGEGAARNRGVDEVSDKFVAFLDADDEWRPEFLSSIVCLIKKYPECGLFGSYYDICEGHSLRSPSPINHFSQNWHGIIDNYFQVMFDYIPFNSSSVVIKKKELKDVGSFPVGVKLGGDIDTWFRLYEVCKFAYLNQPLSIYHFDAENRVCNIEEKPIEGYRYVKTIQSMIANGFFSQEETSFALNYLAKKQIPIARYCIEQGRRQAARKILYSCKDAVKLRKKRKKLYLYSLLPTMLARKLVHRRP